MSWKEVRQRFIALREACFSGDPLEAAWQSFGTAVWETHRAAAPYHLVPLLYALEKAQGDSPVDALVILDHGCGGGSTLIYLLSLGYTGIHGVDLLKVCEGWNRLLKEQCGITEKRFFAYDGTRLPLADRSMDFVFSQQVIEHVHEEVIESYYGEEARVLKPGGLAYHQVPHRLAPYDSHSRTWFVHYLPPPARRPLYRLAGVDPANQERKVHLRWPWFHRRHLVHHIGDYEDLTLSRLKTDVDESYYDGNLRLRRLVRRAVTLPLLGAAIGAALTHFVMLQTLAVKR